MANGKGRISHAEREVIESMLDMGRTFGSIARALGRPASAVSREVAANRDWARAFLAAYGEPSRALPDALGVEEVPAGELVLGPELICRGRLERGEDPVRF